MRLARVYRAKRTNFRGANSTGFAISFPRPPRSQAPDASWKLFQIRFSRVIMEALCSRCRTRLRADSTEEDEDENEDDDDDDET